MVAETGVDSLDGGSRMAGERTCAMSKYISTYEALCPQDKIHRSDPRRAAIIAEMRAIRAAKTLSQAAKVVEWWDVWPNEQHATAEEFCREAKSLMANCP